MEEYIRETDHVIYVKGLGESYDKDWAMRDQGRIEGREERNEEIAFQMLKEGDAMEKISRITSLSEQEILEIADKMKKEEF